MGKGARKLSKRCGAGSEGRRRAVQSRVREEETGGTEETTAQTGTKTKPKSGQARPAEAGPKEGSRATIQLEKAATKRGIKTGFQAAGPITAPAEPAGKGRQPKAAAAGPGQAGQSARER